MSVYKGPCECGAPESHLNLDEPWTQCPARFVLEMSQRMLGGEVTDWDVDSGAVSYKLRVDGKKTRYMVPLAIVDLAMPSTVP